MCGRISTPQDTSLSSTSYLSVAAAAVVSSTSSSVGNEARPILTKSLTAGAIFTVTDISSQHRNQRMAEDQSVVGRRRIYYDPYGNVTLICSDSDEDIVEGDEMKHVFSDGEDQLLCKALKEHGKNQEVLNILSQFIELPPLEIEERFELLVEKYQQRHVKD